MAKNNKVSRNLSKTFNQKPKPYLSKKSDIARKLEFATPLFGGLGRVDKLTVGIIAAAVGVSQAVQVVQAISQNNHQNNPQDSQKNAQNRTQNKTSQNSNNHKPRTGNQSKFCQKLVATELQFKKTCPLNQNYGVEQTVKATHAVHPNQTVHTNQANKAAKPILFSSHVRSAVHPGLYMLKNRIKSLEEWQAMQQAGLESFMQKNPQLENNIPLLQAYVKDLAKTLRQTFEVDQTYKEAGPADRLAHDQALNWLESDIIPVPLELMGEKQLEILLKKLNFFITAPDEKIDPETKLQRPTVNKRLAIHEYRTQGIHISKIHRFPDIIDGDACLDYLRVNDPDNVEVYKTFAKYQNEYRDKEAHKNIHHRDDYFLNFITKKSKKAGAFLRKYFHWCPEAPELPVLMKAFLAGLKPEIKKDPIKAAAYAHMRLVEIHPFEEGNGRTARALMNVILIQNGLPNIAFLHNKEYMEMVNQAVDKKDIQIFETYLRAEIELAKKAAKELKDTPSSMRNCVKTKKDKECQSLFTQWLGKIEAHKAGNKKPPTKSTGISKNQEKAAKIATKKREIRRKH